LHRAAQSLPPESFPFLIRLPGDRLLWLRLATAPREKDYLLPLWTARIFDSDLLSPEVVRQGWEKNHFASVQWTAERPVARQPSPLPLTAP
jgi:hypothetical protein